MKETSGKILNYGGQYIETLMNAVIEPGTFATIKNDPESQ